MKQIISHPLSISVVCSLSSFVLSFIVIPNVFRGWMDLIWMTFMVVLPAAIAVLLFRMIDYRKPGTIFFGLLIQYALLIAFAGPISEIWGASIAHTLGWFSYIGAVFPWPFVITLIQYLTVAAIRKNKS